MNRQQQAEIAGILDESGIPWEIRCGKKHRQIVVAGQIVARVPRGTKGNCTGHQHRNVVAKVRRVVKESRN